jgi:hypothetical protein
MKDEPSPVHIEVSIRGDPSPRVVKAIRHATGQPLMHIQRLLKKHASVYSAVLVPEQFFSAVKPLLAFLDALEALGVTYRLTANGKSVDKAFLEQIKSNIEHVTLADFR